MSKLVEFQLAGGEVVYAEVDDSQVGNRPISREGIAVQAALDFDEAMSKLKPIISSVVRNVRDQIETPQEFTVELGLKLSGQVGLIVANSEAEGSIKISLTWKSTDAE